MTTRRKFALAAGVAAGIMAAPGIVRAQTQKWRMVTSWPKRLPGPGMSAGARCRAHSHAFRWQAGHCGVRGR